MTNQIGLHDLWPNMSRQQVGQMICDQHLAGSNMKHRSQQLVADRHQRDTQTRRAPKPTDTSIPPGAEAWALGDTAQRYRELQSLERRIDATLMRKTTEHNDSTWQDTQVWARRVDEDNASR